MNKKGFAISVIMYSILILFIVLLTSIMGTLATRKTLLDKSKKDVISFLNAQESTITANQESTYVEYKESNPLPGIYFDTEATNVECEINGEIYTNTKSLELGEYELTCTIVYDDIRYASARTTLIVDTNNFEYTKDFIYKNEAQEWTVPRDGYYQIELWGAQGGSGGNGGYTSGLINLSKAEVIYFNVGGKGVRTYSSNPSIGGYNGGGAGGRGTSNAGGSGGGATDIRCFVDSNNKCVSNSDNLIWDDDLGLNSRIMVAGGGGGINAYGNAGGPGGGLNGIDGTCPSGYSTAIGHGGTQISGGARGTFAYAGVGTSGTFGQGGNGDIHSNTGYGAGAGGGGYYGGGGGSESASGGGGGSSFISGYKGSIAIANKDLENDPRTVRKDSVGNDCTVESATKDVICSYHYSNKVFTNTVMKSGNESMPTHDGTSTMTGNTSDGHAKITYIGKTLPIGTTFEYAFKPSAYKFIVPESGKYQIELWGAKGGYTGGNAAYASGIISFSKNENLYVYVGQTGNGMSSTPFNGGGGKSSYWGGGASDIRCFADSNNKCVSNTTNLIWDDPLGLNSRIMVAAGSGAGGNTGGGAGGILTGLDATCTRAGGGATQTSGGTPNGIFGMGVGSIGGGGGYYGGGGGADCGAGGSSFASGYQGAVAIAQFSSGSVINEENPRKTRKASDNITLCTSELAANDITCSYHYSGKIFTNIVMKAGNESMPTHDGTSTMTGNSGDGYAKITYLGNN